MNRTRRYVRFTALRILSEFAVRVLRIIAQRIRRSAMPKGARNTPRIIATVITKNVHTHRLCCDYTKRRRKISHSHERCEELKELFVDNFAGGGGASTGIEMAIGRSVDIAINHDPDAIAMHKTNHPASKHYCEDVCQVDPVEACAGNPVALAWFSPDCKHFSRAKGGKPVDKNIRGLAWVAIKWAYTVRPKVLMLENVPEIQTWGPLGKDGKPIKERAGETFMGFILALTSGIPAWHPAYQEMCDALSVEPTSEMAQKLQKGLGYNVQHRTLKSCDYGAPTTRTRFYLIARCDGRPIVWAEPTHAPKDSEAVKLGLKLPYRTAAECIDWSIPAQSIFEREKPLAENTLRRIARGIQKFVIDNPEPFIVTVNHSGEGFRGQSTDEPLGTITAKNGYGVVTPTIMCNNTNNVGASVETPLPTVTTGNRNYLVAPSIVPIGYGEREGQAPRVNKVDEPLGTVVTSGKHYLVAPTLIQYHSETAKDEVRGQELTEPLMTQDTSNRYALSVAHIMKNYGGGYNGAGSAADAPLDTVTTKDRFALVTIHGEEYIITDIKMRMLQPRELFNAQGFPHDYIIDHDAEGRPYPKSKQVARCGNAVTPQVPAALVRANLPEECIPIVAGCRR